MTHRSLRSSDERAGIARERMLRQGLSTAPFATPGAAVHWLGAVQAQEYALAKSSVAQRVAQATSATVEHAIADGTILRTHVLRPTWHFVAHLDIRWLLELTAPRVHAMAAYRRRQLGIDGVVAFNGVAAIASALEGGNHLTRRELTHVLSNAGIAAEGQVVPHLLMLAELDAVICSGVPRGKQQTYGLLDERAPDAAGLPRDEALAELTARYFTSHGPATVKDFQWWSSLTATDAKRGLEMVGAELQRIDVGGRAYWSGSSLPPARDATVPVHLVQQFDEVLVGYSESRDVIDLAGVLPRGQTLTTAVLVDGQVVGRWRRPAGSAAIQIQLLRPLNKRAQTALAALTNLPST